MKYKNINSMLHNFAHSFCSDMNMLWDGNNFTGFVFKEINLILEKQGMPVLRINFSTGDITPNSPRLDVLRRPLETYKKWLEQHSANHDADLQNLTNITLEFTPATRKNDREFVCVALCEDDRGKTYRVEVSDFS